MIDSHRKLFNGNGITWLNNIFFFHELTSLVMVSKMNLIKLFEIYDQFHVYTTISVTIRFYSHSYRIEFSAKA